MPYLMKATFSPAKRPQDGYLGSITITVADSILLRGIALFQSGRTSSFSLRFPTFGEQKQSYIFPRSRDAYRSMLRLSVEAFHNMPEHTATVSGATDISLTVSGELLEDSYPDGRFSLCIPGLCALNGITTQHTPYPQPDQSHVLVDFPSLIPHQVPKDEVQDHLYFHGLAVTRKAEDGSVSYQDYNTTIKDMVRAKRAQLLAFRDRVPVSFQQESEMKHSISSIQKTR